MERQHPVVEQISRRDGRLGGVKLCVYDLAVGVDIGVLVGPPDTLQRAHIERVL